MYYTRFTRRGAVAQGATTVQSTPKTSPLLSMGCNYHRLRKGRQAHNSGRHTLGASWVKDITSWHPGVSIQCHMPCGIQRRQNIMTSMFSNVKCPLQPKHTPHTKCLWTNILLFLLKHSNWPPTPGVQCPMTASGRHSLLRWLGSNHAACLHRTHRVRGTLHGQGCAQLASVGQGKATWLDWAGWALWGSPGIGGGSVAEDWVWTGEGRAVLFRVQLSSIIWIGIAVAFLAGVGLCGAWAGRAEPGWAWGGQCFPVQCKVPSSRAIGAPDVESQEGAEARRALHRARQRMQRFSAMYREGENFARGQFHRG